MAVKKILFMFVECSDDFEYIINKEFGMIPSSHYESCDCFGRTVK